MLLMAEAPAVNPAAGSEGWGRRYIERAIALNWVRLYQVHDRFGGEAAGRLPVQRHLMLYVLSGNAAAELDGNTVRIPHRHLYWIKPGCAYRVRSDDPNSGTLRLLSLEMKPLSAGSGPASVFLSGAADRPLRDTAGIGELLLELLKELQQQDHYTPTMIDSLMNRLLVHAGRLAEGADVPAERQARISSRKELVYRAVQYIDQHVERLDGLGELAALLDYSYSHLSHAFRAEMGVPLQAYWVQRRMNRAMSRLQTGDGSITQISEDLRYQSVHAFSKAFKKATGLTPSEYQSLYGKRKR